MKVDIRRMRRLVQRRFPWWSQRGSNSCLHLERVEPGRFCDLRRKPKSGADVHFRFWVALGRYPSFLRRHRDFLGLVRSESPEWPFYGPGCGGAFSRAFANMTQAPRRRRPPALCGRGPGARPAHRLALRRSRRAGGTPSDRSPRPCLDHRRWSTPATSADGPGLQQSARVEGLYPSVRSPRSSDPSVQQDLGDLGVDRVLGEERFQFHGRVSFCRVIRRMP
jgi:hypothetical protein